MTNAEASLYRTAIFRSPLAKARGTTKTGSFYLLKSVHKTHSTAAKRKHILRRWVTGRAFDCSTRCPLPRKPVAQWQHLSRCRRCTAHGRIKEDAVLPLIDVEVRRSVFSRQLGPPVRLTCCDISVTHARSTSQLLRGKFFLFSRAYTESRARTARFSYPFHQYNTKPTIPACVKKKNANVSRQ